MHDPIPLNRPWAAPRQQQYVQQALAGGKWAGDNECSRRCAELLEKRLGIERVLLTPSCTAALEMAAVLCDLQPGDDVLMPSFTFVSTASAVVRAGGRPVFVDIREDTLNLDESLLEPALTSRTRAVIPVHYGGVACQMDAIMDFARRRGLTVIEDAAQAVNAWTGSKALGSIAPLAAFSFHETKNYSCGEGGALCVNDPQLIERAEIIRDKGTNRRQFLQGAVDKYTWVDHGSSYLLPEVAAALLLSQLEQLDEISRRRAEISRGYRQRLAPLEQRELLRLPCVPEGCRSSDHLFYMLLPSGQCRDELLRHLRERGVQAAFHYVPLHGSPMGRRYGHCGPLPVTERASARLLRLPFFYDLTDAQLDRVAEAVESFFD